MKKSLIYASAIMATILAGCSEDVFETKKATLPESNQVTLTVAAVTKSPDLSETRIAYGSEDATWEEGDKIFLIKSDGTTIELTLSDGAGTSSGTFTSTDAIVEGTYTPYAVSATSLTKGFVSVSDGAITLDLSIPGGSTLAEALEHDILKGTDVTLEDDQAEAEITGLTTHFLSYLRFRFNAEAKAIHSVGMKSAGGLCSTVTIAADGTVSGSGSSTDAVYAEASSDANTYSGYFAVYEKTTTSLIAIAVDEDEAEYSRLVSTKDAEYDAGKVYGKTFTLSDAMMTAEATGTLSNHNWKNLGLSVKWAEINLGATGEADYNYSDYGSAIPLGWRKPTKAEVSELFYASTKTWVTGVKNGVKFDCCNNYLFIGAGGIYYEWFNNAYSSGDRINNEGTNVMFWVSDAEYDACNISSEGTILGFGNYPYYYNSRNDSYHFYNAALRLVCDY